MQGSSPWGWPVWGEGFKLGMRGQEVMAGGEGVVGWDRVLGAMAKGPQRPGVGTPTLRVCLQAGECQDGGSSHSFLGKSVEAGACLECLGPVLFVQCSAQSGKSFLSRFVPRLFILLTWLADWQEKITGGDCP